METKQLFMEIGLPEQAAEIAASGRNPEQNPDTDKPEHAKIAAKGREQNLMEVERKKSKQ